MDAHVAHNVIKKTIEAEVFVRSDAEYISDGRGEQQKAGWLFDFRRVIMKGTIIEAIGASFTHTFKDVPSYQICGLEVAAIPLVTGITQYRYSHGVENANGFFIRKSRKKEGLLRMVEGSIQPHTPIILVDDLMNQGKSFLRQIEVLESLGHTVHAVWTILRFRDTSFYEALNARGIAIHSLFTLDDFEPSLKVKNLISVEPASPLKKSPQPLWKFTGKHPNYFWVVPKSTPLIADGHVYFATDEGVLRALSLTNGSTVWEYKVGMGSRGKTIFSSPCLAGAMVVFGSYDGNVYALAKDTGKKIWISYDGDYVGSSPTYAEDLGLIFVGLEFGFFKKRGGIIALDARTGKKVWWDNSMPNFTHASPLYLPNSKEVVIGSNDGIVRLYDARDGTARWKVKTGDPSPAELTSGFSACDIKESCLYVQDTDSIVAANIQGDIYAIARNSGQTLWHATMELGSVGTPLLFNNKIYVASLDKHIYCFSIHGERVWKRSLGARIFASPTEVRGHIVIGSNTGRCVFLHPDTGEEYMGMTLSERITNKVAFDTATNTLIVPTYANEIYAVRLPDDNSVHH